MEYLPEVAKNEERLMTIMMKEEVQIWNVPWYHTYVVRKGDI